jgi:hypothetical protein
VRTQVSAFKATDQSLGRDQASPKSINLQLIISTSRGSFFYSTLFLHVISLFVGQQRMPFHRSFPNSTNRAATPLIIHTCRNCDEYSCIIRRRILWYVCPSHLLYLSLLYVDPPLPGKDHVRVTFRDDRARFVWPFFSSVTLALFTLFQASCFCFAFYRLMRALWIQRKFEADSKDAAVLFRGIGWINAGIKLGAIETVVGFVFYGGIPIAYVRRILRMLSRAFLSIGVAKG